MNGDAGEVRIERIRAVRTAPEGIRLVIVKVETSTPGLYGLGCATFTQRPLAVCSAIEDYLDPLLRGADAQQIEDCWHVARLSSYWRDGPVLNNALGGVDMALWDLKGKIAGLPLYQLLGGKLRASARVYVHAHGRDASEVTDSARALLEAGFSAIRCQVGVAGAGTYGVGAAGTATQQVAFDPDRYARVVPTLFAHLRDELGWDVDLLHDTHERLAPPAAVRLARELEPFGLYFLEDVVAPEDHGWLEHRVVMPRCRSRSVSSPRGAKTSRHSQWAGSSTISARTSPTSAASPRRANSRRSLRPSGYAWPGTAPVTPRRSRTPPTCI